MINIGFARNFAKRYLLYLYAMFLSLIPVFWAKSGEIIAGGDDNPFLNPASFVKFSTWDTSGFANNLNIGYPRIFPCGVFWLFFQKVGLEDWIIQKLWLFSMWFIASLSITYLLKVCFPKKYKRISFFAIPFYLLAPFNVFIPLAISIRYVHSFLPLMLAIFIKGLKSNNVKSKNVWVILFGFASLFSSTAFNNPATGITLLFVPYLYFIFYLLLFAKTSDFKSNLFYVIKTFIIFILFNAYWLWVYTNLGSIFGFVSSHNWGFFGTTSLSDLFRTLGGWAFAKDPMNVFEHSYYQSFGIVLATYGVFFIAISSAIFVCSKSNILFFLLLLVISLFLAKGTLNPWGDIYEYFIENFSVFRVFREPWTKFTSMYLLSLAVMFGYASSCIIKFLSKFKTKVILIAFATLTLFLVFVNGYPAIFGFNLWKFNLPGQRSVLIRVPQYWKDMVSFFNDNDKESVVYITPRNFSARDYIWGKGISGLTPFEYLFIKNPIRYSSFALVTTDPIYNGMFLLGGNYYSMLSENFLNYLNIFGIKYIIQENDIMWGPWAAGNYPPYIMKQVLSNKDYLEKIKEFGQIDVYKVKDEFYKPIFYVSNKVILTDGPSYTFSSWSRKEEDFSLISTVGGINSIEDSNINLAYQVVPQLVEESSTKDMFEFVFNVVSEGDYDFYINVLDSKKVGSLEIYYQIDAMPEKKVSLELYDDPKIEKYLDLMQRVDLYRSLYLGKEKLQKGTHKLTLKSSSFNQENFGGLIYIVFNKYFEEKKEELLPDITFKKMADTKYLVTISNIKSSFFLNFAQDFNKGWNIYVLKGSEKVLLDVPHFVINGINNGWYITPDKLTGDGEQELIIEFNLQKVFHEMIFISIVSIIGALSYLSVFIVKRKKGLYG